MEKELSSVLRPVCEYKLQRDHGSTQQWPSKTVGREDPPNSLSFGVVNLVIHSVDRRGGEWLDVLIYIEREKHGQWQIV